MKKLILISLILFPFLVYANPIWLGVSISEVYFSNSGEWTIEIDNVNMSSVSYLDSLVIECNSGFSTITTFDTTDFIVITNENLKNPITINKNDDCIKLFSYSYGTFKIDSICIGENDDSYLKNIELGQSVARLYGYGPFYKDNSPTIGYQNDLEGSKGKIYGYFYDTNGETIANKYFFIDEGYATTILQEQGFAGNIMIDENGFYCAEISSRSYSIKERLIYVSSTEHEMMQFQPINFDLNENDSINIDFNKIITSTKRLNINKVLLSNFPNPASDHTYFIFDLNGFKASSLLITIYNLNGKIIDSFIPDTSQYYWNCSNLPRGTYLCTLSTKNQTIGVNKFQIAK